MRSTLRLREAALWVLGAGILAQLAGGVVADLLRSWLMSRGASAEEAARVGWVVIPSMAAVQLTLLAVSLYATQAAGVAVRSALGLRGAPPIVYVLAVLGTVLLGPTGDFMMRLARQLIPTWTFGVVPFLNQLVASTALLIVWPVFALLPGIAEELTFRGLLQQAAGRSTVAAIAISGVAFSLFHIDPHHILGVLPIGLFLAWVASRSSSYVTVVAHAVNNTAAIAIVRSQAVIGYGEDDPVPLSWLAGSLVLSALCAVALAHATRETRREAGLEPAA
jgi:membrane protease YdiL (CAAX protease family)